MWLTREFPTVEFERYADDAVVHCVTQRQAREVLAALVVRMGEVGLLLHPDKTKIVYCKDSVRRGDHEHTSFTFLGFTFGPRQALSKDRSSSYSRFLPAVSQDALTAMGQQVRQWRLHMWVRRDLVELATMINPVVVGAPPATHQHLPDALGCQEVQTAAVLPEVSEVVVRAPRSRTRTVPALAVGPHVRRTSMRRAE